MKVLVVGANGQLGSDLVRGWTAAGHDVMGLTHKDISVEDIDSVRKCFESGKPQVVLNTAAYHVVPKCEEHPEEAFAVNGTGALNCARIAQEIRAVNVYFSTDYVFDGKKGNPYHEGDATNPLNVYAATKLAAEHFTLNYSEMSFVVRVSGIYGVTPCRAKGGNFITTMLRLAKEKPQVRVVTDEILTPTPTSEIARRTLLMVGAREYGLYHLTSEGMCSWFEFAKVIFETLRIRTPLSPASTSEFPSSVRRPMYSVLENARFNKLQPDSPMPHWKDSLVEFLNQGSV